MQNVEFTNFIGFGNRITIDIRVTHFDPSAWDRVLKQKGHVSASDDVVKQFSVSGEADNTGDSDGIASQFNELASRLLVELACELHARGLSALHVELAKRLADAFDSTYYPSAKMGNVIGMIYELNREKFRVE